jgi:hypothetical protein
MKNIFFDKSFRLLSEIIKWYEDGSFIADRNDYNVPELLTHISDGDLEIMIYGELIRIFGIQDDKGYVHINKNDIERLIAFKNDPNINPRERWLRARMTVQCVFIDYKSDEDIKKHFFERILK